MLSVLFQFCNFKMNSITYQDCFSFHNEKELHMDQENNIISIWWKDWKKKDLAQML